MNDRKSQTKIILDGLIFPEGPRWHNEKLWFSDMGGYKVMTVDLNGKTNTIVEMKYSPSGLGFLPDERLLIVSMQNKKLMRLDPEGLTEVADLSNLASDQCNDMVVDKQGRAYIGNFGFDFTKQPLEIKPAELILVKPDGKAQIAAKDMIFPNGTVVTSDEKTLIVAETFANRLTAFSINPDGTLTDREIWAKINGVLPDGICLDAEGAIWVANPAGAEVIRVLKGGEIADRIRISSDNSAYACMLGGKDRKTLFICTSSFTRTNGRIEVVNVDIPGAGLP